MGLIALGALVFLVVGLSQGGGEALATLIVVPAVAFVYLVIVRISMEAVALFFRIGENTSALVAAAGLPPSGGYGQVGPGHGGTGPAGHAGASEPPARPSGPTGSAQEPTQQFGSGNDQER